MRAWVEARNQAMRTGSTREVESLSAANCRSCENSIAPIVQVHSEGGSFRTVGWRVVASEVLNESRSKATVSAALKYASGSTIAKRGAEPVVYDEESHLVEVALKFEQGAWRVSFLGYLS